MYETHMLWCMLERALISSHVDGNFAPWLMHDPRAHPHIMTQGRLQRAEGEGLALKTGDISAEL